MKKSSSVNGIIRKLVNISKQLDVKIDEFRNDHNNVETIIDGRLEEFRSAQNAAFEELEAALNLLEKHQAASLTRFRNVTENKKQSNKI